MGAKLDSGVGKKRGRPDINAEPNVIPFIDVMLVLLIIFMVTAPIAAVDIKTDMPQSKVLASKRDGKPVWVTLIDGDDCASGLKGTPPAYCPAVYVMEKLVPVYQVGPETLAALQLANPGVADLQLQTERRIYVRASGVTRYKNVTEVMRNLQDFNLTRIALVTNDLNR